MAPRKKAAAVSGKKTVMILVPNVWAMDVKWFMHDVVEVDADVADLLVGNKQAKETKDDATHRADFDGKREAV